MLQPGVGRATSFALFGFLTGSLITMVVRGLQNLSPLYDPAVGVVLGGFMAAIFFVWGIGAFNPLLSVHGGDAEKEAHDILAERARKPQNVLASTIWSLVGWTVLILVLVAFFALLPGGFALTTTAVPEASTAMAGFVDITLFGYVIQVSQVTVLIFFVVVLFVTLFAVSGAIGYGVYAANRGVVVAAQEAGLKLSPSTVLEQLPPGTPVEPPKPKKQRHPLVSTVLKALAFIVVFAVLYLLFYYVAIGLIFPAQPWLTILSLVNALVFTVLIVRPASLLIIIGKIAALVARFIRAIPRVLFQRG
ncbi:MAG: hypothetical protein JNL34_01545 [Anaerolineae bacterium]|nr:hypothetical protein [Anaerolineae bacterium]